MEVRVAEGGECIDGVCDGAWGVVGEEVAEFTRVGDDAGHVADAGDDVGVEVGAGGDGSG